MEALHALHSPTPYACVLSQLRRYSAIALLALVPISPVIAAPAAPAEPAQESQAAFDARMRWWREARLGVFVHWGLYSAAAGYWNGQPVWQAGEWIQRNAEVPTDEYARVLLPRFKHPKPGFAREWARLARAAGAKYLVFTSKHHEGFALHDSAVSDFDAKDLTGRDLSGEIIAAARAEGLKIGLYHSVIDWHHPAYPYRDFARIKPHPLPHPLARLPDERDPDYAARANLKAYQDFLHAQVRELVSRYGPIDILWWDYSKPGAEGETWRAQELMTMVREYQPGIISNNRLYATIGSDDAQSNLTAFDRAQGDFTTPEQAIPARGVPGVDWEACMTMNDSWGYSAHDEKWKSSRELVRNLIDTASKGGNYLLNIGPMADGSVPEASARRLEAIGAWLQRNGESIYGSQASPLDAVSWGRITTKPGRLYLHVFDRPGDGVIRLPLALASKAQLLDGGQALAVTRDGDGVAISLPFRLPDRIDTVVVVETPSR